MSRRALGMKAWGSDDDDDDDDDNGSEMRMDEVVLVLEYKM